MGTGEELPEVAQAFQRQPHEPVNPHACWYANEIYQLVGHVGNLKIKKIVRETSVTVGP